MKFQFLEQRLIYFYSWNYVSYAIKNFRFPFPTILVSTSSFCTWFGFFCPSIFDFLWTLYCKKYKTRFNGLTKNHLFEKVSSCLVMLGVRSMDTVEITKFGTEKKYFLVFFISSHFYRRNGPALHFRRKQKI